MSYEEVKKAVKEHLKTEFGLDGEVDTLLARIDLKRDGKLDKSELVQVIKTIRDDFINAEGIETDDHSHDHGSSSDSKSSK